MTPAPGKTPREERVESAGGLTLFVRSWRPDRAPRGVVAIIPGFNSHGGSQHFYDAAGSADKTLKLYDGYFHDLLNDVGKEKVMADIKSWIDARLPRT